MGNGSNAWSNTGTITATNSTVNLGGSFTTAGLGTFSRTGGTVNLTGTLTNTAATLNLDTTTGTLNLVGGTIANGTLMATAAQVTASSSGGTLSGVTLDANLNLTAQSADVMVTNGLTLNGTATIGASSGNGFNFLEFSGSQTLSGSGAVLFGSAGYTALLVMQSGTTLTIGAGIAVHGGSSGSYGARLGYSDYNGVGSGTTIINQGTIDADTAGTSVTIYPSGSGETFTNQGTVEAGNSGTLNLGGTWTSSGTVTATGATLTLGNGSNAWNNTGTITATNSTVNLGGSFTTAGLGTFSRTGGTVNLTGTLTNTAATLNLDTATGTLNLVGGTIANGTLMATAAQLTATSSGGTLSGVTLDANLNLTAQSADVMVTNGLTLNGTATIGASSGNGFNFLEFSGSQTLSGSGAVLFGSAGYTALLVMQSGTTLTIGAGIAVHGGSSGSYGARLGYSDYNGVGSGTTIINQGTIDADTAGTSITIYPSGSGGTFTNQGTVEAGNSGTLNLGGTWTSSGTVTASGATLNLGNSTNAWSNTGTITASNSTLNLGGSFTTAGLGTFSRAGGTVNLTGTLNNTAATLALNSATGSWNLLGGTVSGGTVSDPVVRNWCSPARATLGGVTAAGNLDFASNNDAYAYVTNGLTLSNNATIYVGNAPGTTYGYLAFQGTETLGGTGTVLFGGSGSNTLYTYNTTYNNPGADTLTIGSGITIRGSSGRILDDDDAATVVNQGTISADSSGALVGNFVYDQGYNGGYTRAVSNAIDTSGLTNPAPQAVYQTERYGYYSNFGYALGGLTPGGTYTLQLDFADLFSSAAGQNKFNVTVNGTQVLTNFDIYAAAGAAYKAVAEQFSATADSTGTITVNFVYVSGYAQICGLEVQSGGSDVLAVNAGLLPGGTITVNPSSFTNQGSLQVSNGEALSVSGLSSNVGGATLSGSGSSLTLNGSGYVVNQALAAAAGQTLTLNGTWGNVSTITAAGATLNLGNSTNAWSNTGTMTATNSTVSLGGGFTTAGLGTFNRTGGTVNLTGTLNNTAATLPFNAATGSWNLAGGTLENGTYTATGGADLIGTSSGGTLSGVTAAGNLDFASNNDAYAYVTNGLTLSNNATIYVGNAPGTTYGYLAFQGTETLGGTGTVLFGGSGSNTLYTYNTTYNNPGADTLTIGSGITIRGSSGRILDDDDAATVVNQGTISADSSGGVGGQLCLRPGLQRWLHAGGFQRHRHQRADEPGAAGGLPDRALWVLQQLRLRPGRPDPRRDLHAAIGLCRPVFQRGGAEQVQRHGQRHAGP